MHAQLFLAPYADACDTFVTELGDWLLWGTRQEPASTSGAAREWTGDLDGVPWLLNPVQEADRHGVCLLDAAFSAFEGTTLNPHQPRDYLALAAGLRASLEAAALAAWLLDPTLGAVERVTRLGDLCLDDLTHRRTFLRDAGLSRNHPNIRACDAEMHTIVDVLTRLGAGNATVGKDGAMAFGPHVSTSARIALLGKPRKQLRQSSRAQYALFSSVAHASITVIRDLYPPRIVDDAVQRRRSGPGHRKVGVLLASAATALVTVQADVAERFGWEADDRAVDALLALASLADSEPQ